MNQMRKTTCLLCIFLFLVGLFPPSILPTAKAKESAPVTLRVTKDATKKVYLGNQYQIYVPGGSITSCKVNKPKLASVTKGGIITLKKAGKTKVTIRLKKKSDITLTLTIIDPTVPTKVVIQEGEQGVLFVGEELLLTAKVTPKTAGQSVQWKSSKKAVASVSMAGLVRGLKKGKATITATAGKKKDTFTVTVKASPTPTPTVKATPTPTPTPAPTITVTPMPQEEDLQMHVQIGNEVFSVILEENDTARSFYSMVPMTLEMEELNGNEKYVYLDRSLPSAPQQVGNIQAGDLMLFGNNCVVLFYKSFSTSYTYTRIGRLSDTTGLQKAVGRGSIEASFTK